MEATKILLLLEGGVPLVGEVVGKTLIYNVIILSQNFSELSRWAMTISVSSL